MKLDPTIERLNFNNYSDTTAEHLHRYAIVKNFINQKIVLDIASGEGYGSYLMSKSAKQVYGVDIDSNSIKNAQLQYKRDNLKFLMGSADKIPLKDNSVDAVISFETIEHHDKHNEMFEEILRVLKPKGVVIMSSPDKEFYSDKTGYRNKFHTKELYFKEFKTIVESYFKHADFYFQKAINLNSYIADINFFQTYNIYTGDQHGFFEQEIEPLYNIAIASNTSLNKLNPSIYSGEKLVEKKILQIKLQTISKVKESITFKVGKYLLKPFTFFLKK